MPVCTYIPTQDPQKTPPHRPHTSAKGGRGWQLPPPRAGRRPEAGSRAARPAGPQRWGFPKRQADEPTPARQSVLGEGLGGTDRPAPLQRFPLGRLLGDRGGEANRWVAAVTEENKKGEEPPGRRRPAPRISGCWEPGARNKPSPSEGTCSVSLVRKPPARRDASQAGGLCSGQRARVSCVAILFRAVWPRHSTFPRLFPKEEIRGLQRVPAAQGSRGMSRSSQALGRCKPLP